MVLKCRALWCMQIFELVFKMVPRGTSLDPRLGLYTRLEVKPHTYNLAVKRLSGHCGSDN